MFSLVLVGSMLASSPELPVEQPEPMVDEVGVDEVGVDEAIVIAPPSAAPEPVVDVVAVEPGVELVAPEPDGPRAPPLVLGTLPPVRAVPPPPWSGAGRFVGGAAILAAGLGLLTAASFEYAGSRDSTRVLIGQVPAGVSMVIAGGFMLGTGARDQRRLSDWEAGNRIAARPMGTGMIVGGVTAVTLGSLAAVATSIAADMDLNAPRSIPAGWATAGVAIGGGAALLVAGAVRRARYEKWRNRVSGVPMIAPTRGGATIGVVGQF